jgi:peptide/nickel transport system permease protein
VTGYLIRRVAQSIIVVFGVVLLTFLLSHLYPRDSAARACLGPRANQQQIQQFNHENHYDVSLARQFWLYTEGIVVHGDLGRSCKLNQSVRSLIDERIPKTLVLVGISTLFALLIAIPLGILQVVRRNTPVDYMLTGASFVGYAMPAFLLGELLILWFALDLHWFSFEAPQTSSTFGILTQPDALVLPVFTLAVLTIAGFSRYMRSSMMEALTEDYIRTARAKGASPRRVLYRHALRNALIPIITLLGLTLPAIVGGAIIVETVFNYPGMGLLTTSAATQNDVPLLIGTTFIAAIATVVGNLIADLLYAVADPRVRYA